MSADPHATRHRAAVRVVKRRVAGQIIGPAESDLVAIEDPLEISIASGSQNQPLAVTMRTPGADEDLIAGYLFAEGLIESIDQLDRIEFDPSRNEAAPIRATAWLQSGLPLTPARERSTTTIHSACGICGTASIANLKIPDRFKIHDSTQVTPDWIHDLPNRMRAAQPNFDSTGGLHAAAIFEGNGGLMTVREDIGRHNALDKAIGDCLRKGLIPAPGRVLCVSGRMSYEILQKSLIARIPIIAGVGAPSSLAVTLADDFHVTVLGFVRNQSYNIYSHPERIGSRN